MKLMFIYEFITFIFLNYFIKLDDMWMSDKFQNVNLSSYSFNITHILDFVFLKNLDSDLNS